jgi:hypothetical protein
LKIKNMGIENMIAGHCTSPAVYWGSPQEDGLGGKTFASAIEILCRWEEIRQVVTDAKGNEITSRALVFVTQDLDEEGVLYLGTLDSLYDSAESSGGAIDDPQSIDGAYIIKRFQKTPTLDGTNYLRKAYLTPSLSFGGF